jgi:hypothetical protein
LLLRVIYEPEDLPPPGDDEEAAEPLDLDSLDAVALLTA